MGRNDLHGFRVQKLPGVLLQRDQRLTQALQIGIEHTVADSAGADGIPGSLHAPHSQIPDHTGVLRLADGNGCTAGFRFVGHIPQNDVIKGDLTRCQLHGGGTAGLCRNAAENGAVNAAVPAHNGLAAATGHDGAVCGLGRYGFQDDIVAAFPEEHGVAAFTQAQILHLAVADIAQVQACTAFEIQFCDAAVPAVFQQHLRRISQTADRAAVTAQQKDLMLLAG